MSKKSEKRPDPPTVVRLRCGPGKYGVDAVEAEVRLDGARIAGGNGSFEFDLYRECWVEIAIIGVA